MVPYQAGMKHSKLKTYYIYCTILSQHSCSVAVGELLDCRYIVEMGNGPCVGAADNLDPNTWGMMTDVASILQLKQPPVEGKEKG